MVFYFSSFWQAKTAVFEFAVAAAAWIASSYYAAAFVAPRSPAALSFSTPVPPFSDRFHFHVIP